MSESPYALEPFLRDSREKGVDGEPFEEELARMVRIDVDGDVWLKPGAAIAYRGDIAFERLPTLGARSMTEAVLRELAPLTRARGKGRLYCGYSGRHARLVRLRDEAITVVWEDLLAFEQSLAFEVALVAHGLGVAAGGLVTVKLSGTGAFAIGLHGEPLTLPVTPDNPLCTDPHATLAWSVSLTPSLKTDLSWRSVFRHGGQEPIQMHFAGSGFVVVQPCKDSSRVPIDWKPLERMATLLAG